MARIQNKETTMSNILIDGSKMRTDAFYGQNGSSQPSSIRKGETIKRSQVGKSIVAADGSVSASPGDWQTRDCGPSKLKSSPTMHSPNKAGDKVPSKVSR
jgi:hypothetical protein